jgi:NAD+ synthase (glutamine-hydrolysing)
LEIPGYSCEDHFLEMDTVDHSWEVLAEIIQESRNIPNLLIDTGMPVLFKGSLYNCRIPILNG